MLRSNSAKALLLVLLLFLALSAVSCASRKKVVTEIRTQVVHQRDTVHVADSFISSTETVIQEADSSVLARYGIKPSRVGMSWIIRQANATRSVSSSRAVSDRDSIRTDSSHVARPTSAKATASKERWTARAVIVLLIEILVIVLLLRRPK